MQGEPAVIYPIRFKTGSGSSTGKSKVNKYVGYIVMFEAVAPFQPQTAEELLNAFSEKHPRGVRTHHYRTIIRGDKLEGLICVDNKAGKKAIVNMIDKSKKLMFIGYRAVTLSDLEKHYKLRQVSLKDSRKRRKR